MAKRPRQIRSQREAGREDRLHFSRDDGLFTQADLRPFSYSKFRELEAFADVYSFTEICLDKNMRFGAYSRSRCWKHFELLPSPTDFKSSNSCSTGRARSVTWFIVCVSASRKSPSTCAFSAMPDWLTLAWTRSAASMPCGPSRSRSLSCGWRSTGVFGRPTSSVWTPCSKDSRTMNENTAGKNLHASSDKGAHRCRTLET